MEPGLQGPGDNLFVRRDRFIGTVPSKRVNLPSKRGPWAKVFHLGEYDTNKKRIEGDKTSEAPEASRRALIQCVGDNMTPVATTGYSGHASTHESKFNKSLSTGGLLTATGSSLYVSRGRRVKHKRELLVVSFVRLAADMFGCREFEHAQVRSMIPMLMIPMKGDLTWALAMIVALAIAHDPQWRSP